MADPFVGEIQAFPFPWAIDGFNTTWLPCLGQLLPIQQYSPLFALIGISYGGNGTTNFALPNLNGAITVSQGQGPGLQNRILGKSIGAATVTLTSAQMASHTHAMQLGSKTAQGATAGPVAAGTTAAIDPSFNGFVAPPPNTTLAPNAITSTGQGLPHDNTQPTQALIWCIAYGGTFPVFG